MRISRLRVDSLRINARTAVVLTLLLSTLVSLPARAGRPLEDMRLELAPIEPFVLQTQQGQRFDQASLQGRWSLLMTGFTYCPDICPVHLSHLAQLVRGLRQEKNDMESEPRVVFLSVDPKRDTPEVLGRYLNQFDPAFVGLTGNLDQIKRLEASLKTAHRLFSEDVSGHYDVMHATPVYVISPDAKAYARIDPPFNPALLNDAFKQLRADWEATP